MKIKEYIINLEKLISELKEYDQELPIEMKVTPPHYCCGGSGDNYCYADGDDYDFTSLSVNEEKVYNKKSKKQELKKIWIRGDY